MTRQGIAGVRNLCLVLFPETGAGDGRGWASSTRNPTPARLPPLPPAMVVKRLLWLPALPVKYQWMED